MRIGMPRVGDYGGSILYNRYGVWVVSVSRYEGYLPDKGYTWKKIPAEQFFRLDVLTRQVAEAGLDVKVEGFQHESCILRPNPKKNGLVIFGGRRIKAFMNKRYGQFGMPPRPVRWEAKIAEYD